MQLLLSAVAERKIRLMGQHHSLDLETAILIHEKILAQESFKSVAQKFDVSQADVINVKMHRVHPGSFEQAVERYLRSSQGAQLPVG